MPISKKTIIAVRHSGKERSKAKRNALVKEFNKKLQDLQQKRQLEHRDVLEAQERLEWQITRNVRDEEAAKIAINDERINKEDRVAEDLEMTRRSLQNYYTYLAILLPPILPLVIAIAVFVIRTARERASIEKRRRK